MQPDRFLCRSSWKRLAYEYKKKKRKEKQKEKNKGYAMAIAYTKEYFQDFL